MAGTTVVNIRQTAVNAASEVASALTQAGLYKTPADVRAFLIELRDELYTDLKTFLDQSPQPQSRKGGGGGQNKPIENPGSIKFNGGKFEGLTVAAVAELTAEQAAEYGYTDQQGEATKTGKDYLKWVEGNKKNPYMQKVVKAFIEERQAGTATAGAAEAAPEPATEEPAASGSDW